MVSKWILANAFKTPIKNISNKLELQMTSDHFVSKSLRIYYTEYPFYSVIEFSKEDFSYNEDSQFLLPRPIIVYINDSYTSNSLEKRYSNMIQERLHNDTQTFDNVRQILKIELLLEK
jgi:hypothetical protein